MQRVLALCVCLVLTSVARAVSIDPDIAIESLAAAYSKGSIDERVDVRVAIDGTGREESFTVRMREGSRFAIELGDVTFWTEGPEFLAVHRLNAGTVFRASRPEGKAGWAVVEKLLPPLLTPQLALVNGYQKGFSAPTGYTSGVVWKSCEVDETTPPPVVRMKGEGPGFTVDLIADEKLSRILRLIIRMEGKRTRIDLSMTREPPGLQTEPLGVDIAGRANVPNIAELAPIAGDVKVGSKLPDLILQPMVDAPDGPNPPIEGPCIIVMWRASVGDVSAWVAAAQTHSRARGKLPIAPIVVFTLGETSRAFKEKLEAWRTALEPEIPRYSLSPSTSIDRFAQGAGAVAVLVDESNTVQAVIPLDGVSESEMTEALGKADPN